jgi:hypothetical protein
MRQSRYYPLLRLTAILLAVGPASVSPAQTPPTQPATPPDHAPATFRVENSDDETPTNAAPNEWLELSEQDRQILTNVRDDTQGVEEAGFYMMLSKVAALPPLDAAAQRRLDSPAPANLLARPDAYRYQPLRLLVRVHTVTRLTTDRRHSDRLISPSPHWPSDQPIYQIHAVAVDPHSREALPEAPLKIYSPHLPPNLPDAGPGEDGFVEYGENVAAIYEIHAVFYKTIETLSRGSDDEPPQLRRYPVVLAWQWQRLSGHETLGALGNYIITGVIALGLILAAAVFFFLRKRTKQTRAENSLWQRYKPLRDEQPPAATQEQPEPDETIDPDLAAAANDYRRQLASPDVGESNNENPTDPTKEQS